MKRLLLILLCLPMIGFGQLTTYVPDFLFEAYLEANGMGNGIAYDNSVFTSAIDTVTFLDVSSQNISELTGIEDFTALTVLACSDNQLTSLNLSQNTALTALSCTNNNLTSLELSQNPALTYLHCRINQLTSLDLSQNTDLTNLMCQHNQLTSLDLSQNPNLGNLICVSNLITNLDVSTNTALINLDCRFNPLTSLDVSGATALENLICEFTNLTSLDVSGATALTYFMCLNNYYLTSLDVSNGNNTNFSIFYAYGNSYLTCINVDDVTWSTANWTAANNNIDPQHYFSNNCSGTGIEENTTNKELLKATDLLGRETKNKPLFYIYNDGTVEKRIVIE